MYSKHELQAWLKREYEFLPARKQGKQKTERAAKGGAVVRRLVLLLVLRAVVLNTAPATGQQAATPPADPCKPTPAAPAPSVPAGVQREGARLGVKALGVIGGAIKKGTKGKLDGVDLATIAAPSAPKPKPCEVKPEVKPPVPPAAPVVKELCAEGMQLWADGTGKRVCSDGVHFAEPMKLTPLPSSTTAAPANVPPGQPAR